MFDLEKFKTGKYYVHLPTLELYREVMKFLENKGFLWIDGDNPTNDKAYLKYMSETCISYKRNGYLTQGLTYADLEFYKEKGYKQLEINKYEKGENMKFKVGDIVKTRFGDGEITHVHPEIDEYTVKINSSFGYAIRRLKKEGIELLKGETSMNEKMKRDLIKLLFEKEYYNHELDGMRKYKGRIIFDYFHRGAKFIDFINELNEEYGIKGHEVAEIIIEEFDLKVYSED